MVDPKRPEESADDLLVEAQAKGFRVSRTQLHQWQQAGYLPSPRQRGLGRGRGTEVLYPPGASRQLIALCELLKKNRSRDAACWGLWWEGYEVSEKAVRGMFEKQLVFVNKLQTAAVGQDNEETVDEEHDLVDTLEELGSRRLRDPVVAKMRRRTGQLHFPTLLNILIGFAAGIPSELEDMDTEILAKGLGNAAKGFESTDPNELRGLPDPIPRVLNSRMLSEALEATPFEDLAEARIELRSVLDLLDTVNAVVAGAMGGALGRSFVEMLRQPARGEGTHIVLLWLSLRRSPQVRWIYENFISIYRQVAEGTLASEKAWKKLERSWEKSLNE